MDLNCSPLKFNVHQDREFLYLFQQIEAFANRLADDGWISKEEAESLNLPENDEVLKGPNRLLIAAFFGGTGVGKSTLLNRLAGENIAQTGIERPTSREVTFYLPTSYELSQLPPGLPLTKVKIVHHLKPSEIVWVDTPDIDSLDCTNRELVLALLPYLDVLIYVVSPERYRDDAGWRLFIEQRLSKAFLFVMNHWDEGCEEQIEDFIHQLKGAGFDDPIVLRCDSRPELRARKPDDFGQLEELLTAFARQSGVERLQARNIHLRLKQIATRTSELLKTLEKNEISSLCARWREIWQEAVQAVQPGLLPSSELLSQAAIQLLGIPDDQLTQTLGLDTWVEQSLADAIERLILEAETCGYRPEPIRRALTPLRSELKTILSDQVKLHLRHALATPGHFLQRAGLRLFGALKMMMPLAASGWAGYQVVVRFYQGSYLGIDFAVHSLLLIGLAWLVPYLLHRLLEPSLEKAAKQGIRRGFKAGFKQIENTVERHLHALSERQSELLEKGKSLIQLLEAEQADDRQAFPNTFARMLASG